MARKPSNIVLHIPHSKTLMPVDNGWDSRIDGYVDYLTDWHTDRLFCRRDERIRAVTFRYSRFYCDVERLENDPMEQVGQGIIYERYGDAERDMSKTSMSHLMEIYRMHHRDLAKAITEGTILIDCHSFPADVSDVEICIGFNEDWSKPSKELLATVVNVFGRNGYSVGINTPYSNSMAPKKEFDYQSLMIEVNKKVYLDEGNRLKTEEFMRLSCCIDTVYESILGESCWRGLYK